MKFGEYRTWHDRRWELFPGWGHLSSKEFYKNYIDALTQQAPDGNNKVMQTLSAYAQRAWIVSGRPYYKVWPSIAESLTKVKLTVPCQMVKSKYASILIRMPIDKKHVLPTDVCLVTVFPRVKENESLVVILCDNNKYGNLPKDVSEFSTAFPLIDGETVEDQLRDLRLSSGRNSDNADSIREEVKKIIRLVTGIRLMEHDPEWITPDVLDRDKARYDANQDDFNLVQRLIDRAHRRGKMGWSVGEKYEVIPHWRTWHPVLVWTGKGRMVPRIVIRKGSIIHRHKMVSVPTGYIAPDGTEEEEPAEV